MLALLALVALLPQAPARASVRTDTLPKARIPDLEVGRRPENRPGADSVGVIERDAIRQGRPTLGLDESLTRLASASSGTSRSTSGSRSAASAAGPISGCAA
jgi:hypothetical protein